MNISNQTTALGYLGSKFSYLPWLLPLLKKTKSWVDLFGGSFVVTINKEPSPIETYNDINKDLVNFFIQLRDNPQELVDLLYLTPHSRSEYDNAWHSEGDTDIERARKFFVRLTQSFLATGTQNERKGWSVATKQSRCRISEKTSKYINRIDGLQDVIERIRRVQIECRDYKWVLGSYDSVDTMFYADPPYDQEKRSGSSDYMHHFTDQDHAELADKLRNIKGYFAVSGYDTALMNKLYKGFYFVKGPGRMGGYSKKAHHECLWLNYDPYNCNNKNLLFHEEFNQM